MGGAIYPKREWPMLIVWPPIHKHDETSCSWLPCCAPDNFGKSGAEGERQEARDVCCTQNSNWKAPLLS